MDEQQPSTPKRTREQEANLQRHLRHQAGMRSKEGKPATTVARGCGFIALTILVLVVVLAVLIVMGFMSIFG